MCSPTYLDHIDLTSAPLPQNTLKFYYFKKCVLKIQQIATLSQPAVSDHGYLAHS